MVLLCQHCHRIDFSISSGMGALHALPMSSFEFGNVAMHVSNGLDLEVWRRPFESMMGGSQCAVTISFKIGLSNSWNSSMHDSIILEELESESKRDSLMMISRWLSSSWASRVAGWDWFYHWGKGATCLYGFELRLFLYHTTSKILIVSLRDWLCVCVIRWCMLFIEFWILRFNFCLTSKGGIPLQ